MKRSVLTRLSVLSAVVFAAAGSPLLAAGEGIKLSRGTISGGGEVTGSVFLPTPVAEDRKFIVEFLEATGVVTPVSVPVVVPAGRSEVKFSAKSSSVKLRVDIKVCLKPDAAAQTACIDNVALRIVPGILQSFSLNRSQAVGGAPDQKVMGTVTLQDPAGPEGVQVSIGQDLSHDTGSVYPACPGRSSVNAYEVPVKAPSSVLVKPGNRSEEVKIPTFPLQTAASYRQLIITASLDGVAKTSALTVLGWTWDSLTLAPASDAERIRTATLTMNAAAPFETAFRLLVQSQGPNWTWPKLVGFSKDAPREIVLPVGARTKTFQVEISPEIFPGGGNPGCGTVRVEIEVDCVSGSSPPVAVANHCYPPN